MSYKVQSKIWPIIKNSKILRSLNLLIALLVLMIVVFASTSFSYRQKIQVNQKEIQANLVLHKSLQNIAQTNVQDMPEEDLSQIKFFAEFEEVIPFIAFLENLFSVVDPDAEIIIKNKESQIFINHFADYTVKLEIKGKKDLFYAALDELDKSRFITNILDFNIN